MKQIIFTTLVFAFVITTLSSCKKTIGKGPIVNDTRSITNFNAIDLSIDADIILVQDSLYLVEISAQQNIIDILETEKNGSTLCIKYKPHSLVKATRDVKLVIHLPQISALDVSGSGAINSSSNFYSHSFDADVSGSGAINLNYLETEQLNCQISGSGKIAIEKGKAAALDCEISGSGDIDLEYVESKMVNTKTSGSGDARVFATQTLHAKISGSGDVYYRGSPIVNVDISGSGKIIHLN